MNLKIIILIFLGTGSIFASLFSAPDSIPLVFEDEIRFYSQQEKELIREIRDTSRQCRVEWFLAPEPESVGKLGQDAGARILSSVSILKSEDLEGKSEKKTAKIVYDYVHERFLEKYRENVGFSKIFSDGIYNCVTASILYGLVFGELGIPYSVKVSVNHVHLLAYPHTRPVMIETTNPVAGSYSFDPRYQLQFVDQLKEAKIISEKEYNTRTTLELFEEYYFSETECSLGELAGILYYNQGVLLLQDQKFQEAFTQFEKGWLLYPSETQKYWLMISLSASIEKAGYTNFEYARLFARLPRYMDIGISSDQITGEYALFTARILGYEGNVPYYDSVYNYLRQHMNNEEIKKEIAFIYNYEMGRFVLPSDRDQALGYMISAYEIKPHNENLKTIILNILDEQTSRFEDPERLLEKHREYRQRIPDLIKESDLQSIECSLCLYRAAMAFEENKMPEGSRQMDKFESLHSKELLVSYEELASHVYALWALHYFEIGQYSTSRSVIDRGLKIVPDNQVLLNLKTNTY